MIDCTLRAQFAWITPAMYRQARAALPTQGPVRGTTMVVMVPHALDPPWSMATRCLVPVRWRVRADGTGWQCLNPVVTYEYLVRYGDDPYGTV